MPRAWRRKTDGRPGRRVASDGLALDVVATYTRRHREARERASAAADERWDAYLAIPVPAAFGPLHARLVAHLNVVDADDGDGPPAPRPVPSAPEQRALLARRLALQAVLLGGPQPGAPEEAAAHHRLAAETWRRVEEALDREQDDHDHAALEAVAAFRAIRPDDDASAGRLDRVAHTLEAFRETARESVQAGRGTDVDRLVEAIERKLDAFDAFLTAGFALGTGPRPD